MEHKRNQPVKRKKPSQTKKLIEILEKNATSIEKALLEKGSKTKRKPISERSWLNIFWPEYDRPPRPYLWPYKWYHFKNFTLPCWKAELIHRYLDYKYQKERDSIKYFEYVEELKKHINTLHLNKP